MDAEDGYVPMEAKDFYKDYSPQRISSPEIVELGDDIRSTSGITAGSTSRDIVGVNDVYVAVGKDDTDVMKWVLGNAVKPGSRVFLVHVFPPITHIPTPVGRLSTSQLSGDQVRFYINEESNKRRNLLQKYVNLCNNAKVTLDTMLLESRDRTKAIFDLIPVLRIAHLVIGTKRPPQSSAWKKSKDVLSRGGGSINEQWWSHGHGYLKQTLEWIMYMEGQKVIIYDQQENAVVVWLS